MCLCFPFLCVPLQRRATSFYVATPLLILSFPNLASDDSFVILKFGANMKTRSCRFLYYIFILKSAERTTARRRTQRHWAGRARRCGSWPRQRPAAGWPTAPSPRDVCRRASWRRRSHSASGATAPGWGGRHRPSRTSIGTRSAVCAAKARPAAAWGHRQWHVICRNTRAQAGGCARQSPHRSW